MSEKSKGDTSRIVKNPLLSVSVTGLTFEDFPNKPLLLPAAPPVVTTPVPQTKTTEDYGGSFEENKKSVTVGQKPEIDTETLSEINLNTTTDDEGNQIDVNDQQNQQSEIQDESILSQAASSFSQLPTVASTVLSTFSKVIKEYTPSSNNTRENSAERELYQPEKPTEVSASFIAPPPFSDSNLNYQPEQPVPEPPKLYSPSDVSFSTPLTSCPPTVGSQNNYRLSAKKKIYAQIPGLSVHSQSTDQQQLLNLLDTNKNFTTQVQSVSDDTSRLNQPPTQLLQTDNSSISAQQKPEERKGLFSFTNLVPPVWQNISGLVQSSTRTETKESDVNYSQENITLLTAESDQKTLSLPPSSLPGPPPFIAPPPIFNQNIVAASQASVSLNSPNPVTFSSSTNSASPSITTSSSGPHLSSNQHIFTPPNPAASSSRTNFAPLPITTNPSGTNLSSNQHIFTPSNLAASSSSLAGNQHIFTPPNPAGSSSSTNFASLPITTNPIGTNLSSNQHIFTPLLPPVTDSKKGDLEINKPLQAAAVKNAPNLEGPPKPPLGGGGGNTFRLQKGTRHYKSAFNPAPSSVPFAVPDPNGPPNSSFSTAASGYNSALSAQPTIFDPLKADTNLESTIKPQALQVESVPLYNPVNLSEPSKVHLQNIPPTSETAKVENTIPVTSELYNKKIVKTVEPHSTSLITELQTAGSTDFVEEKLHQQNIPPTTKLQKVENRAEPYYQSTPPITEPRTLEGTIPLGATESYYQSTPQSVEPQATLARTESYQESLPTSAKHEKVENISSGKSEPYYCNISGISEPLEGTVRTESYHQSVPPTVDYQNVEKTVIFGASDNNRHSFFESVPLYAAPVTDLKEDDKKDQLTFETKSDISETQGILTTPSSSQLNDFSQELKPLTTTLQETNQVNETICTSKSAFHTKEVNNSPALESIFNNPPISGDRKPIQNQQPEQIPKAELEISPQPVIQNFFSLNKDEIYSYGSPPISNKISIQPPPKEAISQVPESLQQQSETSSSFNLANYFSKNTDIYSNPVQQKITVVQSEDNLNQPSRKSTKSTESIPASKTSLTNPAQINPINFSETENKSFTSIEDKSNSIVSNIPVSSVPDPLAFFESFHQADSQRIENTIEDSNSLRIQDFFNNPPQRFNDSGSDLNYKLVGSGITDKRLETLSAPATDSRALSPVSNIVEPPSSSCSEFSSEFTAQIVGNLSSFNKEDLPDELLENFEMSGILGGNLSGQSEPYSPVIRHWFYKNVVDTKYIWTPFSYIDSKALEDSFLSDDDIKIVAVEGGRYDVNVPERTRIPVYWSGESDEVRRCSWFYKAVDSKYVPYEEAIADLLEEEYKEASESGEWHRKIALPTGETVVFHGPTVIVHFLQIQPATDAWATTSQSTVRPRVVKRGIEDFSIENGESEKVDHLLFMVHGVGSACDLKFRPLEEVVDEFRSIATQLIQSHYKNSCERGLVGRVEVLPVSWHSQLHSGESGIDEKLKAITLESIPRLRSFTNDTLLDILFYTSPIFCQNIMNTVCEAINKIYIKYCQRNPNFNGGVSLAGHSLGSLILFDLLCHQKPSEEIGIPNSENPDQMVQPLQLNPQLSANSYEPMSQQVSYTIGPAGTGQPYINYPQLIFHPKKFFALGSPIGMFVTIRGIDALGLDFKFPTCTNLFHIFHPYDPVAYRIEPLINPDLSTARPVLIPHHKGRKRMHLELKETMTRVGADLKQKIVDTFKTTLDSVNFLSSKNKTETKEEIEKEVDKVLEMQLQLEKETPRSRTNSSSTQSDIDTGEVDLPLGKLNDNRRIDYVLQEAPLEFFNEYLFAFASHVCYWESEDTILFIMKEIYSSLGIRTDSQVPQQSMTIERPNSRVNSLCNSPDS